MIGKKKRREVDNSCYIVVMSPKQHAWLRWINFHATNYKRRKSMQKHFDNFILLFLSILNNDDVKHQYVCQYADQQLNERHDVWDTHTDRKKIISLTWNLTKKRNTHTFRLQQRKRRDPDHESIRYHDHHHGIDVSCLMPSVSCHDRHENMTAVNS
jgi:hypothetical protein